MDLHIGCNVMCLGPSLVNFKWIMERFVSIIFLCLCKYQSLLLKEGLALPA